MPNRPPGRDRFEQEAPLTRREAYKSTSSLENGGRKSPFKFEIRKDFYLVTVSFTLQYVFEMFFIILRTFSVLPNVTAPFVC